MTTTPDPQPHSPLQYSVSTVENTNFGDHGERLRRDHVVVPGETVEDLVRRVFRDLGSEWGRFDPTDVIELRVVVDAEGHPTGKVRPGSSLTPPL
jgi:hypothetical protein